MKQQQEKTHRCEVTKISTGWTVECPTCGPVGMVEEYELDAVALADRHQEVGGFEKRH